MTEKGFLQAGWDKCIGTAAQLEFGAGKAFEEAQAGNNPIVNYTKTFAKISLTLPLAVAGEIIVGAGHVVRRPVKQVFPVIDDPRAGPLFSRGR